MNDLSCLCHGTTFDAFQSIWKGSLKPASHVDPSDYRHPGSRSQRPATGESGAGEYALVRNVLMMSPCPYFDRQRYVGGARKDSELYIFLQKDRVAELIATTPCHLYLTHRAAVISCDEWPWTCIQAVFAPGHVPRGKTTM